MFLAKVVNVLSSLKFIKTIEWINENTLFTIQEMSINIVNFGLGSTFSQGPWFFFSKGPRQSLGLLYEVCI